jgi:hypothetical protein
MTDAPLQKYGDGYFTNHWLLDSAGVVFSIPSSTRSTGTLTLYPSGTTPGAGAYEVSLFDPAIILACINRAARKAWPVLGQHYVSHLVSGSPLPDSSFDDWSSSSALRAWEAVTATLARNTSDPLFGGNVARITTAAGYLHPAAQYQTDLIDLRGYNITVYAFAKTAGASNARLNLRYLAQDATATNNNGSYHSGGGGWEVISVTATIPLTAQSIDIRLTNDTTTTVDWDSVWIEGGPLVWRMRLPAPLNGNVTDLQIAPMELRETIRGHNYQSWPHWRTIRREDAPGNSRHEIEFTKIPPAGYRIRLEGPAPLAALSASTDEWEISDTESEYLEIRAALEVLDGTAQGIAAQSVSNIREIEQRLLEWAAEQRSHVTAPLIGGYSLGFDTVA